MPVKDPPFGPPLLPHERRRDPFGAALNMARQSHHQCDIDLAEAFDRARALLAAHICGCKSPQCEKVNAALHEPAEPGGRLNGSVQSVVART